MAKRLRTSKSTGDDASHDSQGAVEPNSLAASRGQIKFALVVGVVQNLRETGAINLRLCEQMAELVGRQEAWGTCRVRN